MAFENRYSFMDRMLHKIAFATPGLQLSVADMEDSIFSKQISAVNIERPVFITAIPRAGTTLLLELLVKQGEFASHSYRDMPFVLLPMLWDKFSRSFRKNDLPRERAHGDGMLITVDSPEAFEEMVWKAFWKSHYNTRFIKNWGNESDDNFNDFLKNHIKKIIALRSESAAKSLRYISKNNLNIARIGYLLRLFPDARIVIPFRDPIQHAASLLKQHLNFIKIHKDDDFAKKYMASIGHYDFGENLRPVDFNQWFSTLENIDTCTLEFWLCYWLSSYSYLKSRLNDQVVLFNYDSFCGEPANGLQKLADHLQLTDTDLLFDQASRIKLARPHDVGVGDVSDDIMKKIKTVYADMQAQSLV